jgi:hypothetical protein
VKFSSPKNHTQLVGLPNDKSVNETVSGDGPVVGIPLNAADGACAFAKATATIAQMQMIRRANILLFFIFDGL